VIGTAPPMEELPKLMPGNSLHDLTEPRVNVYIPHNPGYRANELSTE
jgi:hypothetical protein